LNLPLPRSVSAISKTILLERSGRCEARVHLLGTVQLVGPVEAEFALLAYTHHPLDTSPVSDLPLTLYVRVYSNDLAGAFMPGNAVSGIGHLHAESSPFIVDETFVRRAEAGPVDFDEDLTYTVRS
jgi:hypothetical protein